MENPTSGSSTRERPDRFPADRIFELLSDRRRRRVIECLDERATPVATADLARLVAERESERSSGTSPDDEAVLSSLYHCHLPKLAEADAVEYDRDRNAVEPGATFERVAGLLNSVYEARGSDSTSPTPP